MIIPGELLSSSSLVSDPGFNADDRSFKSCSLMLSEILRTHYCMSISIHLMPLSPSFTLLFFLRPSSFFFCLGSSSLSYVVGAILDAFSYASTFQQCDFSSHTHYNPFAADPHCTELKTPGLSWRGSKHPCVSLVVPRMHKLLRQ